MLPRRSLVYGLTLCVASGTASIAAQPQTVEAPPTKSGDSWTYQNTRDDKGHFSQSSDVMTVERASPSLIVVDVKALGSDLPPKEQIVGPDWSRIRNVNGRQTTVAKPVSFPMRIGKSWTVDYSEFNPNRVHTREQVHLVYEVKDWEDVTVPAGTFKALKIEADGDWTADVPARVSSAAGTVADAGGAAAVGGITRQGPKTFTGHIYRAVWYVPAVGRWVKSLEEAYDANGVRNERLTGELISFKLAEPSHAEVSP